MGEKVKLIIGLFGCFTVVGAIPAIFSRENITTFSYYADVKTGTVNPAPFASQFVISGLLHVTPYGHLADRSYIFTLDVAHGVQNGKIEPGNILENTLPLPEAAKVLKNPFLVFFENNGKLAKVLINKEEAEWSRNMKQSIASTLQLDISSMNLTTPIRPHSFITQENTIYGQCSVSYDVNRDTELGEEYFIVDKFIEPISCSNFNQYTFDFKESMGCLAGTEEDVTTSSRRTFHIKYNERELLVKKLATHGLMNYVPSNANSESHYVLVSQTMKLKSVVPVDIDMPFPELNFNDSKTRGDVSFQKPHSKYSPNAGVDYTYGRHVIDLEFLVGKIIILLEEAVDYFTESNLEMISPNSRQGRTISRILHTIEYLDIPSLKYIHDSLVNETSPSKVAMRNIFLHTLAHVGTDASTLFIRNIVREREVSDLMAIVLVNKLPLYVRVPTQELLVEMEDLIKFGDDIAPEVRTAGIFCFATLIYKTQKYASYDHKLKPELLDRYVHYYFEHVISEPSYGIKIIYIQAMKNIQIGGVHKLLEPIIRGDLKLSEFPDSLRYHAMSVNWQAGRDAEYIHNLYWPILIDTKVDSLLRLNAFVNILDQPPRMDRLIKLFWFMKNEQNEHVYNFYYTMMKSIMNSVDSCTAPFRQMVGKLFPFIKPRLANSKLMTGTWLVDYENEKLGFGESVKLMMKEDEHTGTPTCAVIDYTKSKQSKPSSHVTLWLRVEGFDFLFAKMFEDIVKEKPKNQFSLSNEIKELLKTAREEMPAKKPIHIEFSVMIQGRFILSHYYNETNFGDIGNLLGQISEMESTLPSVSFDELYIKQVPNDLGLPTHFFNTVPSVTDTQIRFKRPSLLALEINASTKIWSHGYRSIEVYNPILDISHSVLRVEAVDVNLTTSFTFGLDGLEPLRLSLKFQLPEHFATGIRSDTKNYIEISGTGTKLLEQYCPKCYSTELVTKGVEYRKNLTLFDLDIEDLGLHFGIYRYNCEEDLSRNSGEDVHGPTSSQKKKNTWNDENVLGEIREWYNEVINPEVSTCGYLAKLEPSINHPIHEVIINLQMNSEYKISEKLSRFPALDVQFFGNLDTKKTPNSSIVQSMRIIGNLSLNEGRSENELQVQITKYRLGQKDLKICIDGYKKYRVQEVDVLDRILDAEQHSIGNLVITIGEIDDEDSCPLDGIMLNVTVNGEMTEKQKKVLQHELVHGKCQKDVEDSWYFYAESSIVPRTPACLREAVLRSDLRKYTYTVLYENVPEKLATNVQWLYDIIHADFMDHVEYLPTHTESGVIKISTEFSTNNDLFNVSVRTPSHEEVYTDIPVDDADEWDFLLDNTRFTWESLDELRKNSLQFCNVYPDVLMNADGAITRFTVPSKWTLLSADYEEHAFSVFVKRFEDKKLGMLMTVGGKIIKVIPSATGPVFTIDDEVVDYQNGVRVKPLEAEDYTFWVESSNNHLLIQFYEEDLSIEWTERSVTMYIGNSLRGKVTGLCGHLDGRYSKSLAKVYTLST